MKINIKHMIVESEHPLSATSGILTVTKKQNIAGSGTFRLEGEP